VSLSVSGPCGSKTVTKSNFITVDPEITPQLVGAWNFDEGNGSTSVDLSGNNNTATLVNATWVDGIRGKAVRFIGDRGEGVRIPASSSLQSNVFTFAAWVRPSMDRGQPIASQGISNNENERWAIDHSEGGAISLTVWSSGGSSTVRSANGTMPIGQWTHIAVSFDGLNVKFYRDGVQSGLTRQLEIGGISSGNYSMHIGDNLGHVFGQETYRGDIDEVRYWNAVITSPGPGPTWTPTPTPGTPVTLTRTPTITATSTGTRMVTRTPTPTNTTGGSGLTGDVNGDCIVNAADGTLILATFKNYNPAADLNQDGVVNLFDYNIYLSNFNRTCTS
jgi:hypothetical protein